MYLFSLSEPSRDWKLLISSYFIRYVKKAISLRGTEISWNFGDFEKAIVWIPKSKTFILQAREIFGASLVAQLLKNLPAMLETWVGKIPWGRARLHTPVFWPGEFHGLYSQWGHKEWTGLSNFHCTSLEMRGIHLDLLGKICDKLLAWLS